jgi:hypothetical protein
MLTKKTIFIYWMFFECLLFAHHHGSYQGYNSERLLHLCVFSFFQCEGCGNTPSFVDELVNSITVLHKWHLKSTEGKWRYVIVPKGISLYGASLNKSVKPHFSFLFPGQTDPGALTLDFPVSSVAGLVAISFRNGCMVDQETWKEYSF